MIDIILFHACPEFIQISYCNNFREHISKFAVFSIWIPALHEKSDNSGQEEK